MEVTTDAATECVALARRFLDAMAARDLDAARRCLAPGFVMTFPGGATFTTLEGLIDWARPRYRSIAKTYEHWDVARDKDGAIVYCSGTLSGEWPDGTPFAGIRFIDRFEIRGGLIADQKVWNDLAEARA